jgi:hypothetical protein
MVVPVCSEELAAMCQKRTLKNPGSLGWVERSDTHHRQVDRSEVSSVLNGFFGLRTSTNDLDDYVMGIAMLNPSQELWLETFL